MRVTRPAHLPVPILFLFICVSLSHAQNLEGGFHFDLGVLDDTTPLETETAAGFGVWANFWPAEQIALSADWSYFPRENWQQVRPGGMVGEIDRNRQYVDVTLQYHYFRSDRTRLFAEAGGGALWNNRTVLNPMALPDFEESGKESTRENVWTLGAGFRRTIAPHLHWIGELKVHNLGGETAALRVFTGLTVSLY